jgi:hypothetical protein
MDAVKSFMGQLINPIAMFTMFLRAKTAFYDFPRAVLVLQVLSYGCLIGGVAIGITREFIAWNYKKKQEEIIYGNLRTNLGIGLIVYSVTLQILCSFLFFWHLYRNRSAKHSKRIYGMMMEAGVQSSMLLGCAICYAVYRESPANWPTTLLPVIASLSCRFIMDQIVKLKARKANTDKPEPQQIPNTNVAPMESVVAKTIPMSL